MGVLHRDVVAVAYGAGRKLFNSYPLLDKPVVMKRLWVNRIKRARRRRPAELIRHGWMELKSIRDRFSLSPISGLPDKFLCGIFRTETIDDLWQVIANQPYPVSTVISSLDHFGKIAPEELKRVRAAAGRSMSYTVDMLGSGRVRLEAPLDWTADFKNGVTWPVSFFRDVHVQDAGRRSDIKIPWELSRLQWLAPVAQAYLIDGDEKYAEFARDVLENWMASNPYARGPNWAVTMEPAMRIFTWTWLFHVFQATAAWSDTAFRTRFLAGLYEHGVFCRRYLEDFGINGNHLTSNAGGLVFLAEFFPRSLETHKWGDLGWRILVSEMFKQVLDDGVDFEGSVSYHRMVAELFLWPALYRKVKGKGVPEMYYERLRKMASFSAAYSGPDGVAPLWGDADDGRPFIFGAQEPSQHGYLSALIYLAIDETVQACPPANSVGEIIWSLGAAAWEMATVAKVREPLSVSFPIAGHYVMASGDAQIFIDCGPVGYGGRGGHGHNDCLSFDAQLAGVSVVSDSGTYVYTENFAARNLFRSTASHNTPQIDGEEINRFLGPDELFTLRADAVPEVRAWQPSEAGDIFIGSHSGYERLSPGLRPVRTLILDKTISALVIQDVFERGRESAREHAVSIPYHLAPGTRIEPQGTGMWRLIIENEPFVLFADLQDAWEAEIASGWISEVYGRRVERPVLCFKRSGSLRALRVAICSEKSAPENFNNWMDRWLSAASGV